LKRVTAALLLAAAVLALPAGARADRGQNPDESRPEQAQKGDDDAALMEFLGGIGSEDDEWIDYLARTDPAKVAAAPKRTRPGSRPVDPTNGEQKPPGGSQK